MVVDEHGLPVAWAGPSARLPVAPAAAGRARGGGRAGGRVPSGCGGGRACSRAAGRSAPCWPGSSSAKAGEPDGPRSVGGTRGRGDGSPRGAAAKAWPPGRRPSMGFEVRPRRGRCRGARPASRSWCCSRARGRGPGVGRRRRSRLRRRGHRAAPGVAPDRLVAGRSGRGGAPWRSAALPRGWALALVRRGRDRACLAWALAGTLRPPPHRRTVQSLLWPGDDALGAGGRLAVLLRNAGKGRGAVPWPLGLASWLPLAAGVARADPVLLGVGAAAVVLFGLPGRGLLLPALVAAGLVVGRRRRRAPDRAGGDHRGDPGAPRERPGPGAGAAGLAPGSGPGADGAARSGGAARRSRPPRDLGRAAGGPAGRIARPHRPERRAGGKLGGRDDRDRGTAAGTGVAGARAAAGSVAVLAPPPPHDLLAGLGAAGVAGRRWPCSTAPARRPAVARRSGRCRRPSSGARWPRAGDGCGWGRGARVQGVLPRPPRRRPGRSLGAPARRGGGPAWSQRSRSGACSR